MRLFFLFIFLNSFVLNSQMPTFTSKEDPEKSVKLSKMNLKIRVVGNIAFTNWEMVFTNASNRQMEGELNFPLPDGVSVSKYAIDINGTMREAVPVNKNKGKQVFEAVEHRRVDPGLLEKTIGNNFRTRIYPIMPNNKRIVQIGYQQELTIENGKYKLDIATLYPQRLDKVAIEITLCNINLKPTIDKDSNKIIDLIKTGNDLVSRIDKTNYLLNEKLSIAIPIASENDALMQTIQSENYFYYTTHLDAKPSLKKSPNTIAIIWDRSLSSLKNNQKKSLDFLTAYLAKMNHTKVALYSLNTKFKFEKEFAVHNGNSSEIIKHIQSLTIDGGTKYSEITMPNMDEILFFSDGISTLSEATIAKNNAILYTIASSPVADFAYLKWLAQMGKGTFINLNNTRIDDALSTISNRPLTFMGIKDNDFITEMYPKPGINSSGTFSISGISLKKQNELTLLFGYGNTSTIEKKVMLTENLSPTNEVKLDKIWAQKKIASLEMRHDQNAEEIETLGKKYNIATDQTSLIVLESIDDYFRYDIVPPASLREEYDRIVKQRNQEKEKVSQSNWGNIERYYNELNEWWKNNIKYTKPIQTQKAKNKKKESNVVHSNRTRRRNALPNVVNVFQSKTSSSSAEVVETVASEAPAAPATPTAPNSIAAYRAEEVADKIIIDGIKATGEVSKIVSKKENELSTTTTNKPSTDDVVDTDLKDYIAVDSLVETTQNSYNGTSYLDIISKKQRNQQYQTYLNLRKEYLYNPTFYYKIAYHFYQMGNVDTALLILSNIADLGLENHQLYRTLTFVYRSWNQPKEALHSALQVVKWRNFEPQNHRDLALAYEDAGHPQKALNQLIKSLETNYMGEMNAVYEGIEDIILMDINRLLQEHPKLKTEPLEKKFLGTLPVDFRVVFSWNMMDVDLDLHIIEPNGEECYYAHKKTEIGARFSKDFTRGYGPEQYLLRNNVKGNYEVKCNYFGDQFMAENGPPTAMIEIYQSVNGKIKKSIRTLDMSSSRKKDLLEVVKF